MAHPISQERINWLQQRLHVVNESIKVARLSMYKANGAVAGGTAATELNRVVTDLSTERAKIEIELHVLSSLVVGD